MSIADDLEEAARYGLIGSDETLMGQAATRIRELEELCDRLGRAVAVDGVDVLSTDRLHEWWNETGSAALVAWVDARTDPDQGWA